MLQQFYPSTAHNHKFELNKDMNFAAAHYVPHEGAGACARTHGHTYMVNLTVTGNELDEQGFLVNFSYLKKLIHGRYDHTLMNNHEEFNAAFGDSPEKFPTTEIVAENIYDIIENHLATLAHRPYCTQVIVRETPTSYIVYRPKGE